MDVDTCFPGVVFNRSDNESLAALHVVEGAGFTRGVSCCTPDFRPSQGRVSAPVIVVERHVVDPVVAVGREKCDSRRGDNRCEIVVACCFIRRHNSHFGQQIIVIGIEIEYLFQVVLSGLLIGIGILGTCAKVVFDFLVGKGNGAVVRTV